MEDACLVPDRDQSMVKSGATAAQYSSQPVRWLMLLK